MKPLTQLFTLTLILCAAAGQTALAGPVPVSAIESLVAAARSENGLVQLQAVLADGKQATKLAGLLRAARIPEAEIKLALQSPAQARTAVIRALGEARKSEALRAEAASILGTELKFNQLAQSIRVSTQAPAVRTAPAQAAPFQSTSGARVSLTRPAETAAPAVEAGGIETEIAQIKVLLQQRATELNLNPALVTRFVGVMNENKALAAEFVGPGWAELCGSLDVRAMPNYLTSVIDTIQAVRAGSAAPAAALESSLASSLRTTPERAKMKRCHLSNSCKLYGGRATAGCSI